jgi:hypothetical protein
MKADQQQRGIPVRMDGCKRKKIFVKDFCCVTKVQNGPPKREREREREREQLHYSRKKKAPIHKGKGGGTQREDECPKSSPK